MIELISYNDLNFWGTQLKNNSWLPLVQQENFQRPAATHFSANSKEKEAWWPFFKNTSSDKLYARAITRLLLTGLLVDRSIGLGTKGRVYDDCFLT